MRHGPDSEMSGSRNANLFGFVCLFVWLPVFLLEGFRQLHA